MHFGKDLQSFQEYLEFMISWGKNNNPNINNIWNVLLYSLRISSL